MAVYTGQPRVAVDPDAVREWVRRTCAEQGVPVAVADERTIDQLVTLLDPTAASSERWRRSGVEGGPQGPSTLAAGTADE